MLPSYTFPTHRHHYAVWTAARAVNRNFTDTATVAAAIQAVGLRDKIDQLAEQTALSPEEYDVFHRETARGLIAFLAGKTTEEKASYGRAAKIIAIYLKTYHLLCDHQSALSRVAHPPIDRILLQAVAGDEKTGLKHLRHVNWTRLDEADYFKLIYELRPVCGEQPFWKLEVYWEAAGGKTPGTSKVPGV